MGLREKLDLLKLSEKERKIAEEKFLTSLSLVSYDELKEIVDYLATKNVFITKARQLKALANFKNDISRNFDILGEIHETEIYVQDPQKISWNVIDINKKIKYCIQNGIAYKKADGTYEEFLFSERLWQAKAIGENKSVSVEPIVMDETIISVEPQVDSVLDPLEQIEFNPLAETEPQVEIIPFSARFAEDKNIMDVKEFQSMPEEPKSPSTLADLTNSVQRMYNELGSIEEQKQTLNAQKEELAGFQASLESQFADLDFDDLGFGRAA